MLFARSVVPTDNPDRYAKQLASHLGRRMPPVETSAGPLLTFGTGRALLESQPGELVLHAAGEDRADLDRVQDVVGRHLERFGQRNELVVRWEDVNDPHAALTST